MTSRFRHALDMSPGRLAAFGAGGVGLAALENQYVGQNLPEPLKNINLGIGATTGVMLGSHNPEMQTAALGSIPLKEMALFGIGGMDRFRRQQQALTDTNLETAKTNLHTATVEGNQAGGKRLTELMFLVPAMAAGGALAYNAYDAWKKRHVKPSKFQTMGTTGAKTPNQRVRIDIPPSALPASFYKALGGAEVSPRGYARLQTKTAMYLAPTTKSATASGWQQNFQDSHPTLRLLNGQRTQPSTAGQAISLLKDMAWQSSGIPALHNAWRDTTQAADNLQDGNYDEAGRYGVSGIGNAALGALALRYGGANVLAKVIGRSRLGGVIRNQAAVEKLPLLGRLADRFSMRQLTEMPTIAGKINKYGLGHELGPMHLSPDAPAQGYGVNGYISGADRFARRSALGIGTRDPLRRALDMSGRYDPKRYAWSNPTSTNPIFRSLLSAGAPGSSARSLPGHLLTLPRYAMNRAVDAGYAAKQFVKRHPVATGWTALPAVGGMGVVADDMQHQQDEAQPRPWQPDISSPPPASNTFMPASSLAGNLLGAFGGSGPMSPLQGQFVHH